MISYATIAARALHETVRDLDETAANIVVKNFVNLLVAKGRLSLAPRILEVYERIARSHEGGLAVTMTTAKEAPDEVLIHLTKTLTEKMKAPVEVQASTESDLLGGAVIRYGDTLLDDTVKRKLELLKISMIA